jgi:kinesin family protein 12
LKEIAEKNYQIVLNDNHALNIKLENLENVFIGNPIQKGDSRNQQRLISDEYMASNVKNFYSAFI